MKSNEGIPGEFEVDVMLCALDGNALCIFREDFVNLQESESVFIALTKEQVEDIKNLK